MSYFVLLKPIFKRLPDQLKQAAVRGEITPAKDCMTFFKRTDDHMHMKYYLALRDVDAVHLMEILQHLVGSKMYPTSFKIDNSQEIAKDVLESSYVVAENKVYCLRDLYGAHTRPKKDPMKVFPESERVNGTIIFTHHTALRIAIALVDVLKKRLERTDIPEAYREKCVPPPPPEDDAVSESEADDYGSDSGDSDDALLYGSFFSQQQQQQQQQQQVTVSAATLLFDRLYGESSDAAILPCILSGT